MDLKLALAAKVLSGVVGDSALGDVTQRGLEFGIGNSDFTEFRTGFKPEEQQLKWHGSSLSPSAELATLPSYSASLPCIIERVPCGC
jgi:hypothetical protein